MLANPDRRDFLIKRRKALLQAFINAPSWAESRRIVEDAPELLTDESDTLLGRLLTQYQGDARAMRILEEHRNLLRRCRVEGVEVAFAGRRDADPEEALQTLLERAASDPEARAALEEMQRQAIAHPLSQALQALIEARINLHVAMMRLHAAELFVALERRERTREDRKTMAEVAATVRVLTPRALRRTLPPTA